MASGPEPADPSPVTPSRAAERGEHWWPVTLAIIVVAGLHVALPAKYRVNPPWVVPVVLLALLAALIIGDPGRIDRQKPWLRVTTSAVIALLTLANLAAAARLVGDIITTNKLFAANATALLATGGVIWATNVIAFGLWYWDLDRGGAAARAHHPDANPAFVFRDAAHRLHPSRLGADVHRLPVAVVLDRHRVQPHRRFRDQTVGQADDDDRGGSVPRHRRARDRPRSQHLEVEAGNPAPSSQVRIMPGLTGSWWRAAA
jgi:hypothetical protein